MVLEVIIPCLLEKCSAILVEHAPLVIPSGHWLAGLCLQGLKVIPHGDQSDLLIYTQIMISKQVPITMDS